MSRHTHAGGTIRAVILMAPAAPPSLARPLRETAPREWEREEFADVRSRHYGSNKGRAVMKRIARRRAAKGYRYEAARNL